MAVDFSFVSAISSPSTFVLMGVFFWKVYPRLLRIEQAALRANHNSSVMVKVMLRRKMLTPDEEKELDLT